MLHLVQALDGHATRRRHQVNGGFGVQTRSLQQLHGALHRLHHDTFGIVGLETQLHATLSGSADIAHGVGYAAGGQRRACCQMLLVGDERLAHSIEDALHLFRLLLRHSTARHEERHRGQLRNSNIRYAEEQRRALLAQPCLYTLRLHAGSYHHQYLTLRFQLAFDAVEYALHQPRLDTHHHHIGTSGCGTIVGRHANAQLYKLIENGFRRVAHRNIFILIKAGLHQSLDGGATHGACTNHCYLHNTFFKRSMKSSASAFVRQSGGSSRRMFVPAQPVKQCCS